MYIGLKNIQHLLSDMPNYLTGSDNIHCLTGWGKLASAPRPLLSHLLYVCEYEPQLEQIDYEPDLHMVCIVKEALDLEDLASHFPTHVSILFVQSDMPEAIHTKLQTYFNIQCATGLFGQTLLEFLEIENGLQSATDYAYRIFLNPVFVFDRSYNLITATWEAVKKLGMEDNIIINKRFSDHEFEMVNRLNHIHNKVKKSEIPIRAFNEELGYEQLYCAIDTKKDLGHIVVSAVNKPLEDIDTEFLLIFKKYVKQQLKSDSFVKTTRGFNYEYFLKDLLDGKLAMNLSASSDMKYVEKEFTGNMYCLTIETTRSTITVNPIQTRNILESRFPNSRTLIYNGQIIAIINMPKNQLMPEEYFISGQKFCQENGLFGGISNCFQNIFQLSEYYFQALRAIELGVSHDSDPHLFRYSDYYLEHVANIFMQKESADTFCHPKMKFLLDYDKTHHSELAYTLYMYLIHERNLVAASEAMDMHRTSLVYRFKKIHSLIGDDFDDYKERLYLILSYEMKRQT